MRTTTTRNNKPRSASLLLDWRESIRARTGISMPALRYAQRTGQDCDPEGGFSLGFIFYMIRGL